MLNQKDNRITISKVAVKRAPMMKFFVNHVATKAIMDTGAESSVISESRARHLSLKILPTISGAHQVDKSRLNVIGSVLVTLHYQNDSFEFDALVCREIGDLMICGNPVMSQGIIPNPVDKCIEIRSQARIPHMIPWRPDLSEPTQLSIALLLRAP